MNVSIDIKCNLTYEINDQIKLKMEYCKVGDNSIVHLYETDWMYFSSSLQLLNKIPDVGKIIDLLVYVKYNNNKITYRYIFRTGLISNIVNISIKDGPRKPSILVNNFGPITHDHIPTYSFWSCINCGSENAIDKLGTKEDSCIIL